MDFMNVEGYDKLSDNAKAFLITMYAKHISTIEDKENYILIKVEEHNEYLKVFFNNGKWLHYCTNGKWY